MKRAMILGIAMMGASLLAGARDINVGIYRAGKTPKTDGVFLAFKSAEGIAETRYVTEITPAALDKIDVLIVPQGPSPKKDELRKWVEDGHGVMTIHDAVGYRTHPALFPEFATGTGNPFNPETGYGKDCIVTATHPAVKDFKAPVVVPHAYWDQVVMECGPEGVVLVREAVVLDKESLASGEPAIIAGVLGKGRYVANGLGIGYNDAGKDGAPQGDELKLVLGLVRWLAGEGDSPRTKDAGAGVKLARISDQQSDEQKQKDRIAKQIEAISAQAIEPWNGQWATSKLPAPAAPAITGFKTPLEFPAKGLQPSGYAAVAKGWTRSMLRDDWKCQALTNTAANPADDEGTRLGYFKPDYNDSAWTNQLVPAEGAHSDDTEVQQTGVTWYRRLAAVPPLEKGQRVVLSFARCGLETRVWVNGKPVGEHLGSTSPFEFDVTDAVAGGKANVIAVRVYDIRGKDTTAYTLPDGQVINGNPYYRSLGHLWGEVFLTVKPDLYAVRTLITPHLASSEIEVDAWLFNAGKEREVTLTLDVQPTPPPLAQGAGVPSALEVKAVKLAPGVSKQTFRMPLKTPVLWTTDNPYLYCLEIKNGSDVLARDRFGFRDFKADGPYFLLNGKKINLVANIVSVATTDLSRRIMIDDEAQFLTRYLLGAKGLNANTIYTMAAPHPSQFYDRCDELGLMVYADWNAAGAKVLKFPNLPMLSGWNKGEGELLAWMAERYNHPSAVMIALGAELYGMPTEGMNPPYEAVKAFDKQGRPVCNSSGRGAGFPGEKTDVNDRHFYPAYLDGSWSDQTSRIIDCWKVGLVDKPPMPVIQYEMDGGRIHNEDKAEMEALLKDEQKNGRIDRQKVVNLLQPDKGSNRSAMPWISALYGFRRYAADASRGDDWREGAGYQIYTRKNVGQATRLLGPLQAGYCPNTETFNVMEITEDGSISMEGRGWWHNRLGTGWRITDDLSKKRFIQGEGYRAWQRVNNPKFICLERFDRNVFAGKTLAARVYAINDIDETSASWTARCVIRDAKGNVLDDRTAAIGPVQGFKRKIAPYSFAVPPNLATGFYRIELFLYEGDKIVSDNYEEFFVMGKADCLAKLAPPSGRRVALYDSRDSLYKAGVRTKDVLDQLQVPYTALTNIAVVTNFDILIVGADSVDENVQQAGDALKAWMENGGRLLQFEQHIGGAAPYWRKLKLLSAKPHMIAEIIESNHPVFKGLDYRHMENWSDMPDSKTPGDVYRMLIGPIDESVLATGAVAVPRNSSKNNQMAMTETGIGKGRLVMSQMEATQRYGKDAVATRLIWNLLEYIIGDSLWQTTEPAPAKAEKKP